MDADTAKDITGWLDAMQQSQIKIHVLEEHCKNWPAREVTRQVAAERRYIQNVRGNIATLLC